MLAVAAWRSIAWPSCCAGRRGAPGRRARMQRSGADHLAARPHRPARHRPDRRAGAAPAERAARARCASSSISSCSARTPTARPTRPSGSTRIRSSAARSRSRSPMRSATTARDKVVLEPFEITEAAEVTSVLLEASVQDAPGGSSRACGGQLSRCSRTACRRRSTSSGRRRSARPSRCWSTAARACRGGWTSCSARPRRCRATCRRSTA